MISIQKNIRVNEGIRSAEVRVIGPNSEQLGVLMLKRALEIARENNLDLVEVAPLAKPPVCRIMDFNKYKYDQEKKERRVKRSQRIGQLKELRVKPHINENDLKVKLKQAVTFLQRKDKVKINLLFRGRELSYQEQGQKVIDRMIHDLTEYGKPERSPLMEGRVLSVVIAPNTTKGKGEGRGKIYAET